MLENFFNEKTKRLVRMTSYVNSESFNVELSLSGPILFLYEDIGEYANALAFLISEHYGISRLNLLVKLAGKEPIPVKINTLNYLEEARKFHVQAVRNFKLYVQTIDYATYYADLMRKSPDAVLAMLVGAVNSTTRLSVLRA